MLVGRSCWVEGGQGRGFMEEGGVCLGWEGGWVSFVAGGSASSESRPEVDRTAVGRPLGGGMIMMDETKSWHCQWWIDSGLCHSLPVSQSPSLPPSLPLPLPLPSCMPACLPPSPSLPASLPLPLFCLVRDRPLSPSLRGSRAEGKVHGGAAGRGPQESPSGSLRRAARPQATREAAARNSAMRSSSHRAPLRSVAAARVDRHPARRGRPSPWRRNRRLRLILMKRGTRSSD